MLESLLPVALIAFFATPVLVVICFLTGRARWQLAVVMMVWMVLAFLAAMIFLAYGHGASSPAVDRYVSALLLAYGGLLGYTVYLLTQPIEHKLGDDAQ